MSDLRARVLADVNVEQRTLSLAGMDTTVLQGGAGDPLVLLHGPGESAITWLPVLPDLMRSYRVIAPDLPGHGSSEIPDTGIDIDGMNRWLDELLAATCPAASGAGRPALAGRVVGGAIGARYASARTGALRHLLLVDSTGLAPFAPDRRFGLALERFQTAPSMATFERAMDMCAFDLDSGRRRLGPIWDPFAAYAVEQAQTPRVQAAFASIFGRYALTPIPDEELATISDPVTMIWGREDLAIPLPVAEAAQERYGWPLHVIDAAGDDPPFDQPVEFVRTLHAVLAPAAVAP